MILPASNFILNRFNHPYIDQVNTLSDGSSNETKAAQFWNRKEISLRDIAYTIAISLAIVAISSNLSDFIISVVPESNQFLTILKMFISNQYLLITTITLILATIFSKHFEKINGSHEIGSFLIYLFFAVIGIPASISLIIHKSPMLLLFCSIVVIINMLISLIFGRLFNFTIEEIIIASNANIGGPTTAAAMSIAQGWENLIVPSILVGTLGYVIGNYYGLFVGISLGL